MTIQRCEISQVTKPNLIDPAGTGVPFSPFSYELKPDTFEYQNKESESTSTSESEGFTLGKAASSFMSGVAAPFKEMLKHPFKTLGMAVGLGYIIKKVPKFGRFAALAGLALGGIQLLTGLGKTASGYFDGDTEKAEEGCKEMGTGTVSTLFSAVGVKTTKAAALGKSAGKNSQLGIIDRVKDALGIKANKNVDYQVLLKQAKKDLPGATFTGLRYEVPATPYFSSTLSSEKSEDEEEPLTFKIADRTFDQLSPEL